MKPKAQPVRAALIGLSSSAITSWASAAHLPALLTPTGRSKITISALLNSSEHAAKSAIQQYKLPAETKAYGSAEDLASDPDIDLVICNTRVDKHYETIIPSVRAGKDVYVEWPIAAKKEHIDELVEAARQSGSRVAVGLQRRWSPPVLALRDILAGGKGNLGKVLSSQVQTSGGTMDREILPTGLSYFADKDVGGNPIVIGVGHVLDFVLETVGQIDAESVHSKAQIQRPDIRIRDPSTKQIVGNTISNVPDLLSFHGTLKQSPLTAPNATLSFSFRRGQPFPGTPALTWTITCEHGEIRLSSATSMVLRASENDGPLTIKVHHFDSDEVEDVDWDWSDEQKQVPIIARDVMACLYAFADGKQEGDGWVGLEDAARRGEGLSDFEHVVKILTVGETPEPSHLEFRRFPATTKAFSLIKEKERIPEYICLFFAPAPDGHIDAICWRNRRLRGIFGLSKDDDNEAADEILTDLSDALEEMEGETDLLLGGGGVMEQPIYQGKMDGEEERRSSDEISGFTDMITSAVGSRNYVDFFQVLAHFDTWCTVVSKVFHLYHFNVDEIQVLDLEEYCVKAFKQSMQDIFSDVPLDLRKHRRGRREWIHNCLGAGDDLELLMDTKTIRDIYQLMTSRPWIFGNFEWNQLSYFRNLEISTTTMLEQVDVELEAAGPELDVLGWLLEDLINGVQTYSNKCPRCRQELCPARPSRPRLDDSDDWESDDEEDEDSDTEESVNQSPWSGSDGWMDMVLD
ncbi:putative oxidoreductase [Stemphylium lycopersici]|nr:putative oxidoreductase [Stemphylium lycopersici]